MVRKTSSFTPYSAKSGPSQSTAAVMQKYIGIQQKDIEDALIKNVTIVQRSVQAV